MITIIVAIMIITYDSNSSIILTYSNNNTVHSKSLEDSLSTSGAKTVGIPVGKDPLGQKRKIIIEIIVVKIK